MATVLLFFAVYWKLSFATGAILITFCCYYYDLHNSVYKEASSINEPSVNLSQARLSIKNDDEMYRELLMLKRTTYWKVLYVCFTICMVFSYASRFIDAFYQDPKSLEIIRFVGLVVGCYHGETNGPSSFAYDTLGYFILFVFLLIEKKATQWSYNHMEVDNVTEKELNKDNEKSHCIPVEDLIKNEMRKTNPEEQKIVVETSEKEVEISLVKSIFTSVSLEYYNSLYHSDSELEAYYYKHLTMSALKNLLELIILFLVLLSCVWKHNIFMLLYLGFLLVFVIYGTSLKLTIWLHKYFLCLLILQYILALASISDAIAPQSNYYPYINSGCKPFLQLFIDDADCPLYKQLYSWGEWANYFCLGKTSNALNYLACDIIVLLLFSIYFQHFTHLALEQDMAPYHNQDKTDIDPTSSTGKGIFEKLRAIAKNKLKSSLQAFCTTMEQILFLYLHIFTLFTIFVLSTQSQGLVSVGYLGFCLFFLSCNVQFAINYKIWKYPSWMRHFLQPYLFLDVLSQFIIQMPLGVKSGKFWEIFALLQPFETNATTVTKLVMLTLISLQAKIFNSGEFSRFMQKYNEEQKKTAFIKGWCCTYLYNNRRITHYDKYDRMKQEHNDKLENIREQIDKWNEKLETSNPSRNPLQIRRLSTFRKGNSLNFGLQSFSSPRNDAGNVSERLEKIANLLADDNKLRKNVLKNMVSSFGSFYIWIHTFINHVLFKKGEKLAKLLGSTGKGAYYVKSRLEKMAVTNEKLKLQIEKLKLEQYISEKTQEKTQEQIHVLEEQQKTMEKSIEAFVKFGHILKHYWMCLYRILLSSTEFYCYLFMILAHLFNGSIISLVYLLSVFGYGLIEHCRPKAVYWTIMLIYTVCVLALKCIIQLDIISYYIISRADLKAYFDNNPWRIGISLFDSTATLSFLFYIIFECLIILGILIHEYVLIFLGLYDRREIDMEDMPATIERLCNPNLDTKKIISKESSDEEEIIPGEYSPVNKKLFEEKFVSLSQANSENIINANQLKSAYSDELIKEEKKDEPEIPQEKKKSIKEIISDLFFKNCYTKTLFPISKVCSFKKVSIARKTWSCIQWLYSSNTNDYCCLFNFLLFKNDSRLYGYYISLDVNFK